MDTKSGGSSPFPPVGYIEGMWVECILPICEDVLPSNRVRYAGFFGFGSSCLLTSLEHSTEGSVEVMIRPDKSDFS
ncbi:unnamed protein product [Rodentolepis nana]|uniref:PPPDE domain-containing protein n=1 Tax=Rodentolepis nana TaxID=102285 RepID=A0A0R3TPS7_RODNA|nr:unnamed protein product [Rodentolepis nana]